MAEAGRKKSSELFFTQPPDVALRLTGVEPDHLGDQVKQLALQVDRLEIRTKFLEIKVGDNERLPAPTGMAASSKAELLQAIRRAIRERAARKNFIPSEFVTGEPSWDILLDLAGYTLEGKRVSISSACIASGVPHTTALRWISIMEKANLIEREVDERDSRRTFLNLTELAFDAITNYFRHIGAISSTST